MARHFVQSLGFAAIATALALQGCGKPSPGSLDRSSQAAVGRAAADSLASRSEVHRGEMTAERLPAAGAPVERYPAEDTPPWLDALLHDPDPNVRIQGLDASERERTASLDPVTYALIDPDEAVRARAQELLEHELARR